MRLALFRTLTQAVKTPADSVNLRALQVLVTPTVARVSGQAITGAVDSAVSEGFGSGGAFMTPSGGGVRINFAADPEAGAANASPRATDPFSSANGSFAGGRPRERRFAQVRLIPGCGLLHPRSKRLLHRSLRAIHAAPPHR